MEVNQINAVADVAAEDFKGLEGMKRRVEIFIAKEFAGLKN